MSGELSQVRGSAKRVTFCAGVVCENTVIKVCTDRGRSRVRANSDLFSRSPMLERVVVIFSFLLVFLPSGALCLEDHLAPPRSRIAFPSSIKPSLETTTGVGTSTGLISSRPR